VRFVVVTSCVRRAAGGDGVRVACAPWPVPSVRPRATSAPFYRCPPGRSMGYADVTARVGRGSSSRPMWAIRSRVASVGAGAV